MLRVRALRGEDGGVATVFAAVAVLALLSVTALAVQVGAATLARNRAETAADSAALAGALRVLDGANAACGRASSVAAANGAVMATCVLDGADVLVTVTVATHLGPLAATATGRARAGPTAQQAP